jgi:hypothetical protein
MYTACVRVFVCIRWLVWVGAYQALDSPCPPRRRSELEEAGSAAEVRALFEATNKKIDETAAAVSAAFKVRPPAASSVARALSPRSSAARRGGRLWRRQTTSRVRRKTRCDYSTC